MLEDVLPAHCLTFHCCTVPYEVPRLWEPCLLGSARKPTFADALTKLSLLPQRLQGELFLFLDLCAGLL